MDLLLFIALLLLGTWWGYKKGALPVFFRLLCLASGYVAAWQFTPALANWLTSHQKLDGVLVYPAAGIALFFGVSLALNIITAIVLWLLPDHIKVSGKPIGALMGLAVSTIVAVVLVWSVGMLKTAQQHRQGITPTATSAIQKLSGSIMAKATESLVPNKESAQAAGQLIKDPISVSAGLGHIAKQPALRDLFTNPVNYSALTQGNIDAVLQLSSFQDLTADEQSMAFFEQTGLQGSSPEEKKRHLATQLSTYAKNAQALKNTPEYQAILADAEIREKIQRGNYLSLLSNPKVRKLTELLGKKTVDTHQLNTNSPTQTEDNSSVLPSQTIYKWQDANGRTHFTSDKPKPGDAVGEVRTVAQ